MQFCLLMPSHTLGSTRACRLFPQKPILYMTLVYQFCKDDGILMSDVIC